MRAILRAFWDVIWSTCYESRAVHQPPPAASVPVPPIPQVGTTEILTPLGRGPYWNVDDSRVH